MLTEIKNLQSDPELIAQLKESISNGAVSEDQLRAGLDRGWITLQEYNSALTKLS